MNRVCKEILAHGTYDMVEYRWAYNYTVDYDKVEWGPEARKKTLDAVVCLISNGHAIAGPINYDNKLLEVRPAANAENDALSILEDMTKDCKHPPDMYTGFWIELTESGRALGERFLLELQNKDDEPG